MTFPNHIAGGIVFTGTMLSFYNVNLFSNPLYLSTAVFFSLIPDIDTPKTMIGKVFYPIAFLINRRFGHRTLTHSLLFLAFLIILSLFTCRFFGWDFNLYRIIMFSIISHLILDMVTIQGVPLFYPFKRNPCVLPADPAYRLTTANPRSELIAFSLFVLLAFTMYPLFSQGFWTSYNRSFGTVAHCDRENTNSKTWVLCDYSYIQNEQEYKDSAIILESTSEVLTLFNHKEVFKLDVDDKTISISYTKPRHTIQPKKFIEVNFMNISQDSITKLLSDKVCSGLIQSNLNVKYIDKGITYHTNFIKFAHSYDFKIITTIDTSKVELLMELEKVNARIAKDSLQQLERNSQYNLLIKKKNTLETSIKQTDPTNLYLVNKFQNELIEIRKKISTFELKQYQRDLVLMAEKENILKQLRESKPLLFSGYLTYLVFGK